MAMEIFKLIGSIFVDSDAAEKSLQKTDEKAGNVAKTLGEGIATAGKWAAGIGAGAVAVGAAMYGAATDSAAAMDEIDKMSQKLGLSREAYQEWDYVLSQAGVEITSMGTGLKTLTNKIDDAKNGSESATAMFEQLGISMDDLAQMSREDIFAATVAGMQAMEDSTARAALANDLFGKSGQELTALFNTSAEATEELKNKAHELGMVISDDAVDAGVELTDTLDTLKRAGSAAAGSIGRGIMPIVQQFALFLIANMPFIQSLFEQITPVITQMAEALLPPLMDLVSQIMPPLMDLISALIPIVSDIFAAVLPVIVDILQMLLPPLIDVVQVLLPPLLEMLLPLLDLLGPLLELLQPILDLVVALLVPLADLITNLLTPLITIIVDVVNKALVPLKEHFSLLSELLQGAVNTAIELVKTDIDAIKGVFQGFIDFINGVFSGDWEAAWNGISEIFDSIVGAWGELFKGIINGIISGINSFIRAVNKIKIPDWVPEVGGKSINIKEIPLLARGGVLERGQVGMLEGSGAEAVVPLENNAAWIRKVASDMDSAVGGVSGKEIVALLMDIRALMEQLMRAGIYLDSKALVGGIAGEMDRKLGQIQAQKARGKA